MTVPPTLQLKHYYSSNCQLVETNCGDDSAAAGGDYAGDDDDGLNRVDWCSYRPRLCTNIDSLVPTLRYVKLCISLSGHTQFVYMTLRQPRRDMPDLRLSQCALLFVLLQAILL